MPTSALVSGRLQPVDDGPALMTVSNLDIDPPCGSEPEPTSLRAEATRHRDDLNTNHSVRPCTDGSGRVDAVIAHEGAGGGGGSRKSGMSSLIPRLFCSNLLRRLRRTGRDRARRGRPPVLPRRRRRTPPSPTAGDRPRHGLGGSVEQRRQYDPRLGTLRVGLGGSIPSGYRFGDHAGAPPIVVPSSHGVVELGEILGYDQLRRSRRHRDDAAKHRAASGCRGGPALFVGTNADDHALSGSIRVVGERRELKSSERSFFSTVSTSLLPVLTHEAGEVLERHA